VTSAVAFRFAPPRPKAAVQRPELYDRLDHGTQGLLTLVTGPPGAGKTLLLSTWLGARPPRGPVAWLSLEPSDGRPVRFWSELLKLVHEASGRRSPPLPDPADGIHADFVAAVAGAFGQLSAPVMVVLDDFEQLHSQQVTESLDRLLRSSQRGLRLVIASRLDPGLSLQRLRLEGQLTELRSTDLALTPLQARELFTMAGLKLTDEQVDKLHRRTEGWVGGLSLAALSLHGHPDPEGFVRTFTGDERTVADYLVEEVLHQQPRAMREFMLRTSVVEDLEPDLVDALTGRDDGARALELLERSNGFLLPLDEHRHRYRYHPMFLELLRSQLKYQMPDAVVLEHKRAARWFATNGMAADALRHAVAAGDAVTATELLSEHWLSLVVKGQAQELADWVDGLAPRVLAGSAELGVAGAGAALAVGDLERADGYLKLVDAKAGTVPAKRRAHFSLSRAILTMFESRLRGDFEATRNAARKVLTGHQVAGLPGDSRAVAHVSLGVAEYWTPASHGGVERLEEALELARRESCHYVALDCLAQLALFNALGGALYDAAGFGQAATRIAVSHGWEEHALAAPASLALAMVQFYWADYDEAGERLESALRAMRGSQDRTTLCLIGMFRALLLGRADIGEAARVAHSVRNDIKEWELPRSLAARAGFVEAALWADAGENERAHQALARGTVAVDSPVETAVVRARLALADGEPAEALRCLQFEPSRNSHAIHPAGRIEALALAAVSKHLIHDDEGALELLEQALSRAQPDGYRVPLLRVGSPLRELLKRRIRAGTSQRALAGDLIQMLDEQRDTAGEDPRRLLLDPLSDREEAVLRYLPTVMSKAEIASELFVSVNTVKTHTKNIYRKLGVGTRTEAVRRAKTLSLV
jgi:LuxR family transcriptional regulator, maltose regulon positive regulatory protein